MKKEEFLKLGLSEELAVKCAEASNKNWKAMWQKNNLTKLNSQKKTLKTR